MIVYDIRYTKDHDGDVLVILLDPWETFDMDLEQIDQTLQLALMNPNSQIPTTCHEINEMESFDEMPSNVQQTLLEQDT